MPRRLARGYDHPRILFLYHAYRKSALERIDESGRFGCAERAAHVERADIGIGQADRLTAIAIELADRRREERVVLAHVLRARPLAVGDRDGDEARDEFLKTLREKFLAADVGITGANFLIAETGSSVIVTNEGNGDLTQTLPRVHIALASIEKVIPTLEDAAVAAFGAGGMPTNAVDAPDYPRRANTGQGVGCAGSPAASRTSAGA